MQRIRPILVLLVAVSLTGVVFAGGGAKKKTEDSEATDTATLTPEQQAIQAYNMGIASRDKAWKLEKKMAESTDAAEREKLNKKIGKSYKTAASSFERAIRSNPMMFEAHSDLGYCLRKQGDFEASLAAYDRALEIEPRYAEAIEYRAEAYLGLNRLDEAKQAYLELFKGQSDQAAALLEAMQRWVAENGEDPQAEAFSTWVTERSEIAGQTKSVSELKDADW
jgi:tetratricopeptide (TPR) repeat protein